MAQNLKIAATPAARPIAAHATNAVLQEVIEDLTERLSAVNLTLQATLERVALCEKLLADNQHALSELKRDVGAGGYESRKAAFRSSSMYDLM